MQKLLALLSEVTRRGLTVGRIVVTAGRATFEIVIRIFVSK